MSANPTFVQALADATGKPVEVSPVAEATTLGAGLLAGLAVGVWSGLDDIAASWSPARVVEPGEPLDRARWAIAVEAGGRMDPGALCARLLELPDRPAAENAVGRHDPERTLPSDPHRRRGRRHERDLDASRAARREPRRCRAVADRGTFRERLALASASSTPTSRCSASSSRSSSPPATCTPRRSRRAPMIRCSACWPTSTRRTPRASPASSANPPTSATKSCTTSSNRRSPRPTKPRSRPPATTSSRPPWPPTLELLARLENIDGAKLVASMLAMEARHCVVLADMSGRGDDLDVLLVNTADPLLPEELS